MTTAQLDAATTTTATTTAPDASAEARRLLDRLRRAEARYKRHWEARTRACREADLFLPPDAANDVQRAWDRRDDGSGRVARLKARLARLASRAAGVPLSAGDDARPVVVRVGDVLVVAFVDEGRSPSATVLLADAAGVARL